MNTTPLPIRPRSRLWGVFWALVVLALLLTLGVWQLERLRWKENLIARQDAALASPPLALSDVLAKPEAERLFWPVTVTGQFEDVAPFVVGMRPRDGQPGYHLVLPFILTEGGLGGHAVLINLGWIPASTARSWRLPAAMRGRTLTLAGIARTPESRTWLMPKNHPKRGEWYAVDPAEMRAALATEGHPREMLPLFVQLGSRLWDNGWPEPLPARRTFRNDHRQYALFWFTMSGVWVVMVWLLARRGRGNAGHQRPAA
jgi:surfeit locus 1 family protein